MPNKHETEPPSPKNRPRHPLSDTALDRHPLPPPARRRIQPDCQMLGIEVERRQNRKKFVTRIRGLEEYQINAAKFSNDAFKRFACSASIDNNSTGWAALNKGCVVITFHGNLAEYLTALLTVEGLQHGGHERWAIFCAQGCDRGRFEKRSHEE